MVKKLLFILMFFMFLSGVNALSTTGFQVYYKLDNNTFEDATGNEIDASNGGTINITGKIKDGRFFDDTDDIINTNSNTIGDGQAQLSYGLWFNMTTRGSQEYMMGKWGTTTDYAYMIYHDSVGKIGCQIQTSAGASAVILSDTDYDDGTWHHGVCTYDGVNLRLYVDSNLQSTIDPQTGTITSTSINLLLGRVIRFSNFFGGVLDEAFVFYGNLTSDNLTDMYNGGTGLQYPFISVPAITSNITNNDIYSTSSINVSLSTSSAVNMSYSLDGSGYTSICNNCQTTSVILSGLSDGNHNVTWLSVTTDGNTTTTNTFDIDTTNPTLSVTSPSSTTTYYANFSSLITYSDANLDTCSVTTDEGNTFDCTNESYLFLTNGQHLFNVSVNDSVGNTNTSLNNIITISPENYFYFQNETGTPIYNFTIDGTTYEYYYNFNTSDFGVGNWSVIFAKLGYETQTINFELTSTNQLNNTYTTTTARIELYIRDQNTGSIITGTEFNVDFIATIGYNTTTTTGLVNVSNTFFLSESYYVVVTHPDYETETTNFLFTNREVLTLNIYMINSSDANVGVVFVKPVDRFGQPIVGATTRALQWDAGSSSYVQVSTDTSGSDGLSTLNIILNDEIYLFSATYEGITANTSSPEIIDTTENGKTITITLAATGQEYSYLLENIATNVTQSFNNVTNISTITFSWVSEIGSISACINSYRDLRGSRTQLTNNCTSGESGVYILNFFVNSSYTTILSAEIIVDGVTYNIRQFTHYPSGDFDEVFTNLGLAIFIVPFLFIGAIALGMMIENVYIGTFALMVLGGLSLVLAPTILTKGIVAFLFFMGWLTIIYGVKSR